MTTAIQPKVEEPNRSWIYTNFYGLHDNCWVLNEPIVGKSLIVLAPTFGSVLLNLGRITSAERIDESRSFWVIADNLPVASGRYELGMKIHLVAESVL